MRSFARYACLSLIGIALARPAHAQTRPFGVSVAYPGAIGAIWQPSARLAFRPDFAFSYSHSDEGEIDAGGSGWTFGTHISGLIYLRSQTPFRIYVVPRYGYRRTTSEISTTFTIPSLPISIPGLTLPSTTTTLRTKRIEHAGAGLVGGEYHVGDHFGIFGEFGMEYVHGTSSSSQQLLGVTSSSSASAWNVGTTTSVGVNVYF
jgi:hypothetical protein